MNRRIQNKQAKRRAAAAKPTLQTAFEEVKVGASHLVAAAEERARTRAGEARAQLESFAIRTEEQAEKLLEKVPGVGHDAARKLHDATHRETRRAH